jgi:hypothetical protein
MGANFIPTSCLTFVSQHGYALWLTLLINVTVQTVFMQPKLEMVDALILGKISNGHLDCSTFGPKFNSHI